MESLLEIIAAMIVAKGNKIVALNIAEEHEKSTHRRYELRVIIEEDE